MFYCVKCKKDTDNEVSGMGYSANGRGYKYGTCSVCSTKKTRFVRSDTVTGEGFSELDDDVKTFAKIAESAYTPEGEGIKWIPTGRRFKR